MHQHRQIHIWITESDYRLLRELSSAADESVSSLMRRLIKFERGRLRNLRGGLVAPPVSSSFVMASAEDDTDRGGLGVRGA